MKLPVHKKIKQGIKRKTGPVSRFLEEFKIRLRLRRNRAHRAVQELEKTRTPGQIQKMKKRPAFVGDKYYGSQYDVALTEKRRERKETAAIKRKEQGSKSPFLMTGKGGGFTPEYLETLKIARIEAEKAAKEILALENPDHILENIRDLKKALQEEGLATQEELAKISPNKVAKDPQAVRKAVQFYMERMLRADPEYLETLKEERRKAGKV